MAYPANHTFSRPVPRDPADEYVHDKLFRIDRRDNALTINPAANNYVRTVSNDAPWDAVLESAGVAVLGQLPGSVGLMARAAYVRSALRPASQGEGRARFR